MKRLGVQQIDLYQIHTPVATLRSIERLAEALAAAKKEGLVKAVGVSNYSADEVRRTHSVLATYGIPLASNQVRNPSKTLINPRGTLHKTSQNFPPAVFGIPLASNQVRKPRAIGKGTLRKLTILRHCPKAVLLTPKPQK